MKQTNKERLENFLKSRFYSFIKTSEILGWGATIGYSNTAGRDARKLAHEGKLRRISKQERILLGFIGNEGVYEII